MKFAKDLLLIQWLRNIEFSKQNFEWDDGNSVKNLKHNVIQDEIMELFQSDFVIGGKIIDPHHIENRWILFGKTLENRYLTLIFTIRNNLVRPISCRPMRKEEKKIYEETIG